MNDPLDIPGLEQAVDPDGTLRRAFDEASLPQHAWMLSVLIPVETQEIPQIARGQRRTVTVPAPGVRSGLFCERCQLSWDAMSPREREACRG